jgi:hypothetical protein
MPNPQREPLRPLQAACRVVGRVAISKLAELVLDLSVVKAGSDRY